MARLRTSALTLLAMIAFAGNSILCRMALKKTAIDPVTFTLVRLLSGACVLWLVIRFGPRTGGRVLGNWWSGLALFVYAAAFSLAYVSLPAAAGALLLFGSVQATMIGYGLWAGERLGRSQVLGLALAGGGLVFLLLPGLSAPPLTGSVLMVSAGMAWGIYSLRGKSSANATAMTAGNFLRAACLALLVAGIRLAGSMHGTASGGSWDRSGLVDALLSGAITSGLGYAIWYNTLRELSVTTAATVQLSVPVLAALGGVALLGEAITMRLVVASAAILSGVLLVIVARAQGPHRSG